jgi:cell cycle checkpoint protein
LIGGDGSIPPTIWIYSDTVEGKVDHRRLGRILDLSNTTANNNNYYQIWQIAPPTKVQFRKVLKAIASQEGVLYKHINDDDFDKLHAQCGGDLRFAISQYQFRWATATKKQTTRRKQQHSTDISLPDSNQVHTRDQRLSSFHALGKLLYAKRYHPSLSGKISSIQQRKHPDDERPSLAFDPETVMEQSEMEVHGILHFLEHHCVDFFTDIFELADSLSYFSDAAVLYDYDSRGGGKNPSAAAAPNQDHAASLACRSVACCNQHAAASRFRQLSAPKIFEVMHKRHENQSRIESMSSVRFFGTTCLRESAVVFATEVLPWSRKIVPSNHPFGCTSFLVSHFDPGVSSALSSCSFSSRQQSSTHHAIEQPAEMIWREQQEILRMDDIVEDGDEDW